MNESLGMSLMNEVKLDVHYNSFADWKLSNESVNDTVIGMPKNNYNSA